jgi:hypothetical protein
MENPINYNYRLRHLPRYARNFCIAFVVMLSIGYFTGIAFVFQTDSNSPTGVEENYNGNEDHSEAMEMKFKKSPREMLTIVHTHILSLSLIFFASGILLFFSEAPKKLKSFLMVEPFVSVLATFGGIYLIWYGFTAMAYVVILSGLLMTISYILSIIYIIGELLRFKS